MLYDKNKENLKQGFFSFKKNEASNNQWQKFRTTILNPKTEEPIEFFKTYLPEHTKDFECLTWLNSKVSRSFHHYFEYQIAALTAIPKGSELDVFKV